MRKHGYIYLTTNRTNGTVYVGQRRGEFKPKYTGSGTLIRAAIEKHGRENFTVELLQFASDQQELDALEKLYINEIRELYPRTYNIRDGGLGSLFNGHGPHHGRTHSEATKKKMSASRSGPRNQFYGRSDLLSGDKNPRYGAKLTQETKDKISAGNRAHRGAQHGNHGKTRSLETRMKISAAKKGTAPWNKGKRSAES